MNDEFLYGIFSFVFGFFLFFMMKIYAVKCSKSIHDDEFTEKISHSSTTIEKKCEYISWNLGIFI